MTSEELREILEKHVDEVMNTSTLAVDPINGYRGEHDPDKIDKQREKDYEEVVEKTIGKINQALQADRQQLVERVEGMKWSDELDDKYEGEEIRRKVQNNTLDDVIKLLEED